MTGEADALALLQARFYEITDSFIERAGQQVELARALNDQEGVVREQIKGSVMKHARYIFDRCYDTVQRELEVSDEKKGA